MPDFHVFATSDPMDGFGFWVRGGFCWFPTRELAQYHADRMA